MIATACTSEHITQICSEKTQGTDRFEDLEFALGETMTLFESAGWWGGGKWAPSPFPD